MEHLIKRQIDAAAYRGSGNSRCVLWDDTPRGLGLRVFPSGRKSFVLSYRLDGRKRLMALGDYGVLTLDEARRQARAELVALESGAADPLVKKRQRALDARTGTVAQMFAAYVADRKPKGAAELLAVYRRHIATKFGNTPWRDVRRSVVRDWHAGVAKPYAANRALQALRAAFYWRIFREDDAPGEPAKRDTRNPCAGIALRPETRRQVRLELTELPRLEKAIDKQVDLYVRALFRVLLATGCRRGEAKRLLWTDVVLEGSSPSITLRDVKARGGERLDRVVPLNAYAVAQLRALPKVKDNPYVFVGRVEGQHLQSVSKAWERIREASGLPHLRIHDLRRSFGSWLGDVGFSSKQIGTTLGHRSDITSRVYMSLGSASTIATTNAIGGMLSGKKAGVRKLRTRLSA
jgi:integrase